MPCNARVPGLTTNRFTIFSRLSNSCVAQRKLHDRPRSRSCFYEVLTRMKYSSYGFPNPPPVQSGRDRSPGSERRISSYDNRTTSIHINLSHRSRHSYQPRHLPAQHASHPWICFCCGRLIRYGRPGKSLRGLSAEWTPWSWAQVRSSTKMWSLTNDESAAPRHERNGATSHSLPSFW